MQISKLINYFIVTDGSGRFFIKCINQRRAVFDKKLNWIILLSKESAVIYKMI